MIAETRILERFRFSVMSAKSENSHFFAVTQRTFAIIDYLAVEVCSNTNSQHMQMADLLGLSIKLNFSGDPFR